uniref:Uncharacterized protein n=1 Tax=Panagrolaimus sp. PS1159 TaxID=55785 RepID=A0AC35GTA3_9BILA
MSQTTDEEIIQPPPRQRIKIPKNEVEEKELKNGLLEDDNEDIAYLNFRIIWPVSICSGVSVFFMFLSIVFMESKDHYTDNRFALNQIWLTYGKLLTLCTDKYPFEDGMLPSILRQVEVKVIT